jgi:hypothetical protein
MRYTVWCSYSKSLCEFKWTVFEVLFPSLKKWDKTRGIIGNAEVWICFIDESRGITLHAGGDYERRAMWLRSFVRRKRNLCFTNAITGPENERALCHAFVMGIHF